MEPTAQSKYYRLKAIVLNNKILNKEFAKDFMDDSRLNEFDTLLDVIIDFASRVKVKGKFITDLTELYKLKNQYSEDNPFN